MNDNKDLVSEKKKQYGLICLAGNYLGMLIVVITAFVPIVQLDIGLVKSNFNVFQILSVYGFWAEDTNLLAAIISSIPLTLLFLAIISLISRTTALKKTILPRVANDECIHTLLETQKSCIWLNVFYVISAWLLILIECEWDFLKLLPWESPFKTMTYIPFLIQIALYFVIKRLKPNEEALAAVCNTTNASADEDLVVNLLIKYKKLLDNGIITQEEYDQKKQEIWRDQNHE